MNTKTRYNPDKHHRRTIRLCGYDYTQEGLYFVTVCCQNKACLFGEIVDGEMILNPAGRMVEKCWLAIPNRYRNVILHEYVVMPNHFHAILQIDNVGATLVVTPDDIGRPQGAPLRGRRETKNDSTNKRGEALNGRRAGRWGARIGVKEQ